MSATGNNYINFVSELIYGDLGVGELGSAAPAGAKNHIHWTRDNTPNDSPVTVTGEAFLSHHLDYMLARYEAWRSKYFLPPLRPWDGQSAMDVEQLTEVPFSFPLTTLEELGAELRWYYNSFRHIFVNELPDEVKAPYSYRYWAFMKWASDLRKRILGQPVIHAHKVFDSSGLVLSEKDFADIFHQVHHVWHTDGLIGTGWTEATPFYKTSVAQHIGKKEISRTQVGEEFFRFHRDHLELFDRWLSRTNQDAVQSINTCAHDTDPNDSVPAGVEADYSGYPHIEDWNTNPPTVIFNDVHTTYWEGDLNEFSNLGEMGQLFAEDFNQFDLIDVSGVSDTGYHGTGHGLNGDIRDAIDNNFSPRFFAWHGFNDDVWVKREPRFNTFEIVQSDDSIFPEPGTLIILRDLILSSDSVDPVLGVSSIDLSTGQGTLKTKLNIQPDPFGRTLDLTLKCEVLRESGGSIPEITMVSELSIIPSGTPSASERLQNTDFFESFVFDGSTGTEDGEGDGPFKSDNELFIPSSVGFKNSRIRVSGYLTCRAFPDGLIPSVSGTISSIGQAVTGVGTDFISDFRQGDLIRANGQVRVITDIINPTSIALLDSFSPDLSAGSAFERIDGFDHESVAEITMIQEKQSPHVTSYLDRSTFSIEQVASSGTTVFDNAFYIVLQDQSERPFTITWPAAVEPALYGLIAPPVYAAGLYTDMAHAPVIELRDAATNALIPDVTVEVASVQPENPTLHPSIPQRITYPCRVIFSGQGAFTGLTSPGDINDLKLVVSATDRAGNQIIDDSLRVRLQINPNPFMLDGETHWLSQDTRAFQIQEGDARFGVAAGWSDPNVFIQQVILNFRTGAGSAGGETFDSLATEQGAARLEYSTSVDSNRIYNFALAKVRLFSDTGLDDLRVNFRFFRWGVANVEFNDMLAYRSAVSGIGLLGRTSTNELASIPFFAEPRVSSAVDMQTQTDPYNLFSFGPTGSAEDQSYFGAYLDINDSTLRYPLTYVDDGPFASSLLTIRDLLEDHHQCMVVELLHEGDPTFVGATPGSSDNLAQRNLLIVQTANPGSEITRTVQHAFNIDLTRNLKRHDFNRKMSVSLTHLEHVPEKKSEDNQVGSEGGHLLQNCCEHIQVMPAGLSSERDSGDNKLDMELDHLKQGWLSQFPESLEKSKQKVLDKFETYKRWTFDIDKWKPTTGLDELVFFWNNLPESAEVELYLPGINVEEVFNFRSLRYAPETVKIIDSQTLRLYPAGTTFLPIANFWSDNLSGMLKVKLPAGIKKGQRYKVDVVQMRADEARTLGGFQLNIQVEKAYEIWEAEQRTLELFHKRLSEKSKTDRWWPVVARQVEFTRARAKGLVDLANEERPNEEPVIWVDPTEVQKGKKLRVILEKIQITDDLEPFFKGRGEFRFYTKVWTPDNGNIQKNVMLPEQGCFKLSDHAGCNEQVLGVEIFNDWVESVLAIQIGGLELDTFDPDDQLSTYKRMFTGDPKTWVGHYLPSDAVVDIQSPKGWKIWLRIEAAG